MQFEQSELLEHSPLAILVCDPDQRILWCNPRFVADTGLIEADIIGHLYESLPLEAIDKHAHLIQLFDASSNQPKKFIYWQSTLTAPVGAVAHYFAIDRNPTARLVQIDGSKLPKRASWVEFLDYEVSRSRRYDNPLSLLKLHITFTNQPVEIENRTIDQTIRDTLMDELRWADMIGNTSQGSYLMVLPETPASALEHLKDKISKAIVSQIKLLSAEFECDVVFGNAYWIKHDDSRSLLKRARENLVEALESRK